jgi:hypothetical protein
MIYFSYLLFISILAINYDKIKNIKYLDILVFFILFLMISLRYRVGGDYGPYISRFDNFVEINNGYFLFEYIIFISKNINLNLFGFHLIYGLIFVYCLFFFLKNFNNIYLSLVILFPVFILIYGFGSIRQGLGVVIFFCSILHKKTWVQLFGILLAISFHLASIIFLFIYFINITIRLKNFYLNFLIITFLLFCCWFFYDEFFIYYQDYIIDKTYDSRGFFYRNFFTLISAIYFCKQVYFNKIRIFENANFIFLLISIISILIFPIGFFFSTPIDRLMGFFLPIQIVALNIYMVNIKNMLIEAKIKFFFCIISFLILFVWYLFGYHSSAWTYELFFFPFKF